MRQPDALAWPWHVFSASGPSATQAPKKMAEGGTAPPVFDCMYPMRPNMPKGAAYSKNTTAKHHRNCMMASSRTTSHTSGSNEAGAGAAGSGDSVETSSLDFLCFASKLDFLCFASRRARLVVPSAHALAAAIVGSMQGRLSTLRGSSGLAIIRR